MDPDPHLTESKNLGTGPDVIWMRSRTLEPDPKIGWDWFNDRVPGFSIFGYFFLFNFDQKTKPSIGLITASIIAHRP